MKGLNDNYRRRILTSLQYADKLLTESLHVLSPGAKPLFSSYASDLTPSEARRVEAYTAKIRQQMARLLENCGIERSSPTTPASGKIRTGLFSVDLTLEDIYPEKMRGYGKMDAAAAHELSWNLQEIRWLIEKLLTFLSETRSADALGAAVKETGSGPPALMKRVAQIIERYGLVEFLPALQSIANKSQTRCFEIAVFGKAGSGKSSLLNCLLGIDLLTVGSAPIDAVPVRIVGGAEPILRVIFQDRTEEQLLDQLANYATERMNHANNRRVIAMEVRAAAARLQDGFAFLEVPGLACFSADDAESSVVCLPAADFGWVMLEAGSALSAEHIGILRVLAAAEVPCTVMLTKCDLLPPFDADRLRAETQKALAAAVGLAPEVIAVSSSAPGMDAFNTWFDGTMVPKARNFRAELVKSLSGDLRTLVSSLLTTLELRSDPASVGRNLRRETEDILRRVDECLASFRHHWEKEFDRISSWSGEILDSASAILAEATAASIEPGRIAAEQLAGAIVSATLRRCRPFIEEYAGLTSRISADIDQIKANPHEPGVIPRQLARLSALPLPATSPLQGVAIAQPGAAARISAAGRERHYRRELEDKAVGGLRQILEEYQPRFQRWFLAAMRGFKESVRLQTDPLRYRSPAPPTGETDEPLKSDIAYLRSHQI